MPLWTFIPLLSEPWTARKALAEFCPQRYNTGKRALPPTVKGTGKGLFTL